MFRFFLPVAPFMMALALACGTVAPVNPPGSGTSLPGPGPAATARPMPDIVPARFFLGVRAPQNEVVVTVSPLPVEGVTTPDAVATVNGQVVEVDAQGQFLTQVTLEEGPNSIEILASNFEGRQEAQTLTVIYIP